jgi:hypothetical protein
LYGVFQYGINGTVSPLVRPELKLEIDNKSSFQTIAAGVPQTPDARTEARTVMGSLFENKVSIFYPTFQYQEQPEPLTLGYEADYLLPCETPSPTQQAMIDAGVKLLIPGELFYNAASLPSLDADPIAQLIRCLGREHIAGVTNYDEAVHVGVDMVHVRALYDRIKEIDPTLPVLMIHAFLLSDAEPDMSEKKRQHYLQSVVAYSEYADVVGFDVYAAPPALAKVTSPYANGAIVDSVSGVEDYLIWLTDSMPDKQHLMVYQGFGFADQYRADVRETFPPEIQELGTTRLTAVEVSQLYDLSAKYNLAYVAWWGQAMAREAHPTWQAILSENKLRSNDR